MNKQDFRLLEIKLKPYKKGDEYHYHFRNDSGATLNVSMDEQSKSFKLGMYYNVGKIIEKSRYLQTTLDEEEEEE